MHRISVLSKQYKIACWLPLFILLTSCLTRKEDKVVSENILTDYYRVKVSGGVVPVYHTRPGALTLVTLDSMPVTVSVDNRAAVEKVEFIPADAVKKVNMKDDVVTFEVESEKNFFVKINDNYVYPLMVSISKVQQAVGNEIRYGKGMHEVGKLYLKSGQTLMLEEGAYLKGCIVVEGVKDVLIMGSGIINGTANSSSDQQPSILVRQSENIQIEGISSIDPSGVGIQIEESKGVSIENVKLLGNRELRMSDDGINIFGSTDVQVSNVISNTRNNSIAFMHRSGSPQTETKHVRIRDCIFWKGDYGNVMEIGYQARGIRLNDVILERIEVAHSLAGAIVGISAKESKLKGVHFRKINIHDSRFMNFDIKLDSTSELDDLLLEDVHYNGMDAAYSDFQLDVHQADQVMLKGYHYQDRKVNNPADAYIRYMDHDIRIIDHRL
ncbi:right-handed parallel beta-helix repeat-containing protein [Limibacter armeniacum]|uniref:right-handed parallel beta-helix repeat-containing protein n=1 Tax=Limibacter armeniacum TaxID=466084 RepID=UPI002FE5FBA0